MSTSRTVDHIITFQWTAAILTVLAIGAAAAFSFVTKSWILTLRHVVSAGLMWLVVWIYLAQRSGWEGVHLWNRAFADASVVLYALTMAIGPLARLWPEAARAIPWRRELGVWATVAAVVHVCIYWDWVYQWDWKPFFYGIEFHPRDDGSRVLVVTDRLAKNAFAAANVVGLVALVYAVVLTVTSNDLSIRLLRKGWTWLMARATTMWVLVLLHTWIFAYMVYAGPRWVGPLVLWSFGVVLALQAAAFVSSIVKRRRAAGTAQA